MNRENWNRRMPNPSEIKMGTKIIPDKKYEDAGDVSCAKCSICKKYCDIDDGVFRHRYFICSACLYKKTDYDER